MKARLCALSLMILKGDQMGKKPANEYVPWSCEVPQEIVAFEAGQANVVTLIVQTDFSAEAAISRSRISLITSETVLNSAAWARSQSFWRLGMLTTSRSDSNEALDPGIQG